MFESSSTTQPSSLKTKQAPTPDYSSLGARPKTPSKDTKTESTYKSTLTINLGSKTSTSSMASTMQSESETSATPSTSTSTEPITTPNPWVDVNSFLNELKIDLQDINQNQESRNTKFKLSLEKSKLVIKKSLEKSSMAIAKEALSEQNTTLKKN